MATPAEPPAPDPKEQARASVQSCIDRVLGGDKTALQKTFPLLALSFAGKTPIRMEITSFVQAYSSDGKLLGNQFNVTIEADGFDYLGRSKPKQIVRKKVQLKDGKWSISLLTEDD